MIITIVILSVVIVILICLVIDLKMQKAFIEADRDYYRGKYKEATIKKKYLVRVDKNTSNKEFEELAENLTDYFKPDKVLVARDETQIEEIK